VRESVVTRRSLIDCLDRLPELGLELVDVIEEVLGLSVAVVYLHQGDTAVVRAIGQVGFEAGVRIGDSFPWTDTLCSRVPPGETAYTCDAPNSPVFADAPHRQAFAIVTYIGTAILDDAGREIGSVCAVDREARALGERDVRALQAVIRSFTRIGAQAAFGSSIET
jgi:GAF domain-containing protein